jgi:hypothetical protein
VPENACLPGGIDRLPTLTEVLELGPAPDPAAEVRARLPEPEPASEPDPSPAFDLAWPPAPLESAEPLMPDVGEPPGVSTSGPAAPTMDAPSLVSQVLAEVQPLLGELLEDRLRQALAPARASAANGLIRDVRQELAATLRELVEEAVARAIRARRLSDGSAGADGAGPARRP